MLLVINCKPEHALADQISNPEKQKPVVVDASAKPTDTKPAVEPVKPAPVNNNTDAENDKTIEEILAKYKEIQEK